MVAYEDIGIYTRRPLVNFEIKKESSDFIVEELFTEEDIDGYERPVDFDILRKHSSEEIIEKIQNHDIERDKKEHLVTMEINEKEERRILHCELKKYPYILTEFRDGQFEIFKSNEKGIFSFILRKENEDTVEAVQRLSKELDILFENIKFAGNKDRKAITFQRISTEGVYLDQLYKYKAVRRERDHLRLGKFFGNKFTIILRSKEDGSGITLRKAVDNLQVRKIPNFFGSQRFGKHLDNHQIGEYIQNKQYKEAIDLIMKIKEKDSDYVKEAKVCYHSKDYTTAYRKFPRNYLTEKSICKNIKKGPRETIFSIKKTLRTFFLHSYQSFEFNKRLSQMIENQEDHVNEFNLKGSRIKRNTFFELDQFAISEVNEGYKVSFILKSSSYATIAIPELIGDPS